MALIPVKMDDHRHEKMKALAGKERGAIIEEYRRAIDFYVAHKTKENMIEDSKLEIFINERIGKLENHLASMLGRTGMDVSMNLMGLIWFLETYFEGQVTRDEIQEKIRKDAARYFSNAIQKDKEQKKAEKGGT